jgi:hypothetical protein
MLPVVTANPQERYEPFPLTEMQQAYWLGRNPRFELGGVGIHLYEELNCRGIDNTRLDAAWQKTILRHDALRTVVLSDGRQRVLEKGEYSIIKLDISAESRRRPACAAAHVFNRGWRVHRPVYIAVRSGTR